MPVDYSRYHPKWSLIQRLILKRANNHCERCGVANKVWGYWIKKTKRFWTVSELEDHLEDTGEDLCAEIPIDKKPWQVNIGIAHLDHDIDNNRFHNLAALCPVCHLNHDRLDNAQRRKYGSKGRYYNQVRISFTLAAEEAQN